MCTCHLISALYWHFHLMAEILLDEILHRLPVMKVAEVRQLTNGPESFTPDGGCLLGEVAEVWRR